MTSTETNRKLIESAMQAAFNGGWAAACMSLADVAEKQGKADFAKWMRGRALKPDRVEIVDVDEPKGAA